MHARIKSPRVWKKNQDLNLWRLAAGSLLAVSNRKLSRSGARVPDRLARADLGMPQFNPKDLSFRAASLRKTAVQASAVLAKFAETYAAGQA